jgi:NAD-dependent DNA ligase
VKQINEAKGRGLARVLTALGIPGVGSTVAKDLARWAGNIERLTDASIEELAAALAKDPKAKKAKLEKERSYVKALYDSLHARSTGDLFGGVPSESEAEASSDEYLKKRDASLPKEERLGSARIKSLSQSFGDLGSLRDAAQTELLDSLLKGVVVARSLFEYLHSSTGRQTLQELKEAGVKLSEQTAATIESKWSGKTYVITGSFDGVTREAIKERLTAFGAHVSDSVSSKTDAVFVGNEPGSKLQKAHALGIQIYGDREVREVMSFKR